MKKFGMEWVGEEMGPDFDNLISSISFDGLTVTAVGVPATSMSKEGVDYELIEMPDGLSAIVAISEEYIQSIFASAPNEFQAGFSFGVFIGNVLKTAMDAMLEEADE